MVLLSFSCSDKIQQFKAFYSSSEVDLCYHTLEVVSDTFLIRPNQIKFFRCFLQFFISCFEHYLCHLHRLLVLFSNTAVILVDASFMGSFAVACMCFVQVLFSLVLLAAEGVRLFFIFQLSLFL